jgi:hypothetical protein
MNEMTYALRLMEGYENDIAYDLLFGVLLFGG